MDADVASGRGLTVFHQVAFGFEDVASGQGPLVFRQVSRPVFRQVLAYQGVASGRKEVRRRPSCRCCTSHQIQGLRDS